MEPMHVRLTIPNNVDPRLLMGPHDALLRDIEKATDALITVRGNQISISGSTKDVDLVSSAFSHLMMVVESGVAPTSHDLHALVDRLRKGENETLDSAGDPILSYRGRTIRANTQGQQRYVDAIRRHTVTFGIGPAGTGKTYLAMAMAVSALAQHDVARIVLTRPVVEAGESLGFLPGTLEEKLDPYIRPLYDALFDMCDRERGNAYIEQGILEIAPLAFMRGRTLNNAFVILDEAQNTTPEQMQMFLTRLGFGSKFVVTGDVTQRDLKGSSGILDARNKLAHLDDIAFVDLSSTDIVRHSLVAQIVEAYRTQKGGEAQ
ncbi:MAG: PhoH family protein [Coriobacteriales bacterium]|nr:PhoH family protein [Coriobacteriales bacterium]